jgi:hypothetical protein
LTLRQEGLRGGACPVEMQQSFAIFNDTPIRKKYWGALNEVGLRASSLLTPATLGDLSCPTGIE